MMCRCWRSDSQYSFCAHEQTKTVIEQQDVPLNHLRSVVYVVRTSDKRSLRMGHLRRRAIHQGQAHLCDAGGRADVPAIPSSHIFQQRPLVRGPSPRKEL